MSKTEFVSITPGLPSLNIARSVAFYTEKLGFSVIYQTESYAVIIRETIAIDLRLCDNPILPLNTECYIWVKNITPLHDEIKAKGAIKPENGLHDTEWGYREFLVIDDDGNQIHFAEHVNQP
ncbi:MAG TPA: VOC family protein [Aggregatilineales bacterium]|nr:VOC family protein [Aggregatilineales bacterium]